MTRSRPEPSRVGVDESPGTVELLPNDLALARAQISSGQSGLAEGTLGRLIARLEASGKGSVDQLDVARALMAEAQWRLGRPVAAGASIGLIRAASPERKRPIISLIEAESLAAAGNTEAAAALADKLVTAVGVEGAWLLRGGVASRVAWPLPPSLRAPARRMSRPAGLPLPPAFEPTPERAAAAQSRIGRAREAYAEKDLPEGDRQLAAALRLDPRLSTDGIDLLEATLGEESDPDRLLLYGDLLRAAGREAEAEAAVDRAAGA